MSTVIVSGDSDGIPIGTLNAFKTVVSSPSVFLGGTTNARGDENGTGNPQSLFTVRGDILVGVYGVSTLGLTSAGGATIGVGTVDNANGIIPSTTATDIDTDEVWVDSTPSVDLISIDELTYYIVTNGNDIVETTANSQDITAGQIFYVALYRPITPGATLISAV